MGEKWRAMSEADKAPYQRMHEEAKARNENAEVDTARNENAEAGTADTSGARKKRNRGEPGKRKRTKNAYAK